jgi:DNA-binding GntR family transcriptional regulator
MGQNQPRLPYGSPMITQPKINRRTAEPIRSIEDINKIRSVINEKPRDLLLFDLAVETGIGMKKLLRLKARDLARIDVGGTVSIKSDHGKLYAYTMTQNVYETFNKYLKEYEPEEDDFLFKSERGSDPLSLPTVSNLVKGWFKAANIKHCHGSISLRKTWEHNQKKNVKDDHGIVTSDHLSIFKPISKKLTIQQTIFNELFNAIIFHKIPPGSRITTTEISKAFKVSKAPVRVAMNWLEARGFIVSHKKGSLVRELTLKEMIEILKLRYCLESAAAKLAYKIRTEETLSQLESIIKRYESTDTFEERDQMNTLFHVTLYRDIDMPLLISLITDLCHRLSPYVALHLSYLNDKPDDVGHSSDITYYHRKIVEGMRRKNPGQVLKYLKAKLVRGEKSMKELMEHA